MALPKNPLECVAPVMMASDTMGPPYTFLGTAFFIDGDGTFLTACHVFDDNPLSEGLAYIIAMMVAPGSKPTMYPVNDVRLSREFDIAMGRADGLSPKEHLTLSDRDAPMNHDILTIEFSSTETRRSREGIGVTELIPGFHKGYVTCYRACDLPRLEGARILEVSFPALKGASGAPIIVEQGGAVVGMILANRERHLLPAHIEVIEGESGEPTETRSYFLPRAYAIGWQHLNEFVGTRPVRPDPGS